MVMVIDDIALPIPAERGQWDAAPHAVPARTDLKPTGKAVTIASDAGSVRRSMIAASGNVLRTRSIISQQVADLVDL